MKRTYKTLACLLTAAMLITAAPVDVQAARKKAGVSAAKTVTVNVGKSKSIQVKTKNVKKITSVRAKSSAKSVIKISKVKKNRKKAAVTVKAMKAKSARITITVKYIATGSKKIATKKLKVTVKGKKKTKKETQKPSENTGQPSVKPDVTATAAPTATPSPTAMDDATATPTPNSAADTTATPTPAPTAMPTPTVTPTSKPTATPTPTATTKPTPTAAPVSKPTATPTPTSVPGAENITGIAPYTYDDPYYAPYAVEVTLDGKSNFDAEDFSASAILYGQSESKQLAVKNVTHYSNKTYLVTFSDEEDILWGAEITVTIGRLQGAKKSATVTMTGCRDNAVDTGVWTVSAKQNTFTVNMQDLGLYRETSLDWTNAKPDWLTWEHNTPGDKTGYYLESYTFTAADVPAGSHEIEFTVTDSIGTTVTVKRTILAASDDAILVTQTAHKIKADGSYIYSAEIASVTGGLGENNMSWNSYGAKADSIENDKNNLNWSFYDSYDSYQILTVSGDVVEEQTYTVTIYVAGDSASSKDPDLEAIDTSLKKTIQVTVIPALTTIVNGTVRRSDGTSAAELDPAVCFTNKATNRECMVQYMQDGNYRISLAEGTYEGRASVNVAGKIYNFYLSEPLVITGDSRELEGIDFICDLEARSVNVTDLNNGASFTEMPPAYKDGVRIAITPRDWYDENGSYMGYRHILNLMPGEYDLHCDKVLVFVGENAEAGYLYTATAHIVVDKDNLAVNAVYTMYDWDSRSSETIDIGTGQTESHTIISPTEKQYVTKLTVAETGMYEIYTTHDTTNGQYDNTHHQDSIGVFAADGSSVWMLDSSENRTTVKLEPGLYYISLDSLCGETLALYVKAMASQKISGQIKDINDNPITFTDALPVITFGHELGGGTAIVAKDGTYTGTIYTTSGQSLQYGSLEIKMPGALSGEYVNFEVNTGESTVEDITFCVITVLADPRYKDGYTCTYGTWHEFGSAEQAEGSVIYKQPNDWETCELLARVTVKEHSSGKSTDMAAFITFTADSNQTVTAEFKDWQPEQENVTAIEINKQTAEMKPNPNEYGSVSDWYCFTTESAGDYQISISDPKGWYSLYNQYGENCYPEESPDDDPSVSQTFRLEAETTYYLQVAEVGAETYHIKVEMIK